MDSEQEQEQVVLVVSLGQIIYKQTDVSAECADKGGEINIYDSEVVVNNYHF